ncbi:MAG: VCBS repeat-containing protein, partial [Spirochaetes bacterium]|nr:VCBS repeat-containing protein [Spirochaetota bacterium]
MYEIIKKYIVILSVILVFLLGISSYSYTQPWQDLNFPLYQVQQSMLAWGDLNNDGYLDVVIAGNDTGAMFERTYVLINNQVSGFNLGQSLEGFYAGSVSLVDYDNDGDLDISINGSAPLGGGSDIC